MENLSGKPGKPGILTKIKSGHPVKLLAFSNGPNVVMCSRNADMCFRGFSRDNFILFQFSVWWWESRGGNCWPVGMSSEEDFVLSFKPYGLMVLNLRRYW